MASYIRVAPRAPTSLGGRSNSAWCDRKTLLAFFLGASACALLVLLLAGPRDAALALARRAAAASPAAALLATPPPPSSPLPCASASGLCSLGRVHPWLGDLSASDAFRQALNARTYKQELVLLCTDGRALDFTLQPLAQMARLGMAHHLLLADSQKTCEQARKAVPSVGCGWYGDGEDEEGASEDSGGGGRSSSRRSSTQPLLLPRRVQGAFRLWALRLRTALRAARLGYNVLVLDADTILFDDPYPYLKHPALLGKYQWIAQPESGGGDEEGGGGFLNGGVYYLQGAAPAGGATFLLYEATRRMLRWDDDGRTAIRAVSGLPALREEDEDGEGGEEGGDNTTTTTARAECCDADQDLLNDVFRTMRTGTLTSSCSLRCALEDTERRRRSAAPPAAVTNATIDEAQARLRASLERVEGDEARCDDFWRVDHLSEAPEWSWPLIYGPTSAGYPDEEAAWVGGGGEEEEEEEPGAQRRAEAAAAARRAFAARRARDDPARVRWGELRVMNARGFDPLLGGRFYPLASGKGSSATATPYSSALDEQLRRDCPHCPWWPDPEDASRAAEADAMPRERLALAPPWLLTSWQAHGWRGYWASSPVAGAPGRRGGGGTGGDGKTKRAAPSITTKTLPALDRLAQSTFPQFPTPSQLIGHVWFVPQATASLKVVKRVLQMAAGAFDWPTALSALGDGAFSACRGGDDDPGHAARVAAGAGGKCGGKAGLRVLALHPEAERALLSGAASWDEYSSVAAGLADAAAALGRVPAWPSVDCARAAALGGRGVVVVDEERARREAMPESTGGGGRGGRTAPYGGLSDRIIMDHRGRCFPWMMTLPACLNMGRGLMPWELDGWLAYRAGTAARAAEADAAERAAADGVGVGGKEEGRANKVAVDLSLLTEPTEGVNVIRLRLDPRDETRRAHLELEAAQQQRRRRKKRRLSEGDDNEEGDYEEEDPVEPQLLAAKKSDAKDYDTFSAAPAPVPGWRVPLLRIDDASEMQRAADALGGALRPVLYLSAPVALAPGSLRDDNDALGGRARLEGARRECFPLIPGSLAEIRRDELRAKAAEVRAAADAEGEEEASKHQQQQKKLEEQAHEEDALHYLLHGMAEPTRETMLLSWASEGLWRGVPTASGGRAA
jgi:hypothetical protein